MTSALHLRIGMALVALSLVAASSAFAQTLRGNLRDDVPNLDPASFNGAVGYRVLSMVYEGLTSFTNDGRLVPALSTSWDTPDEGRTWRFQLRPNVRFHSGRPFTASDVRASFEALLKAKRPSFSAEFLDKLLGRAAFVTGLSDSLEGFVIIDPLTIELRFSEQVTTFPAYPFFIFDGAALADWGDGWFNEQSGGTGPFRLAEWRRGREIRVTANPDYWGVKPEADEVRLLAAPSFDTALAMFDAGELDFVNVEDAAIRLTASDPRRRLQIQTAERRQARFLAMNTALYQPFSDSRVRAAISLAIDRDTIIKRLFGGMASLLDGFGVSSLSPPVGSLPNQSSVQHAFDPVMARKLLKNAGYPDGKGLPPLEFAVIDSARDEGAFIVDQLNRQLGMPVKLRIMERTAIVSAANAGALPFFLAGWTADFPDPLTYLGSLWHSASRFNQSRWRDGVYDRLVDEGRRAADPRERLRYFRMAENHLAKESAAVILPTPFNMLLRNELAAARVSINPYGRLDFAPRVDATKP